MVIVDERTGLIVAQSVWSIPETKDAQLIVDSIGKYSVSYQLIDWKGDSHIPTVTKALDYEEIAASQVIQCHAFVCVCRLLVCFCIDH